MQYHKTAISIGCTTEAALYFDYVIPVRLFTEVFSKLKKFDPEPGWFTDDLCPNYLRGNNHFLRQLGELNAKVMNFLIKKRNQDLSLPPHIVGLTIEEYADIEDSMVRSYFEFLEEFGLTDAPVILPDGSTMSESGEPNADVVIALGTLRLIDSSQASWEQVTELRRDPEARGKLRRLRLFASENYGSKSRAFIEDDLLRRIDDYEEQVRRWGFETKQSVLTMLLTSKYLAGALSGSLISTLFGAPAAAVASAVGGALIEIGRVSLEVSRRRFMLRNALRDNPISYIVDAKDKFGKDT